jgi:hypothetical protein
VTARYERRTLHLRLEACEEALARLLAQPPSPNRHALIERLERERVHIVGALEAGPSGRQSQLRDRPALL